MEKGIRRNIVLALKAFIVGSTMTVPGVSGGSMAMILGEYNRLISSIPGLLKKKSFKKSFIYLAIFGFFGLLGIFLVSKPISSLLESSYDIVMYFFLGAVAGTIPMMVRESRIGEYSNKNIISRILQCILYVSIGIIIVFSIGFLPEGTFTPTLKMDFKTILLQLFGGVLISVGFVLPGISTSYLLVVLGLYEPILKSIASFDILPLIPLVVGAVIGTFALTGFLTWGMEKHPKATYMMILGFLLGSIIEVFPGLPRGSAIISSSLVFVIGFIVIYALSKAEAKIGDENSIK